MWRRRLLYACIVLSLMAATVIGFNLILFNAQEPDDSEELSQPKTNAAFYAVKQGDSLSVIAEKTGVTEERMERLNPKLDALNLLPGQRIRLRPPNKRELALRRERGRRKKPRPASYVLKQGDSLDVVARRNGLNLIELLELNPDIRRPDKIVPGQRIKLRENYR